MPEVSEHEVLSNEVAEKLSDVIERNKGKQGALMGILHETQEYLGYIPYEVQKFIAEKMNVPLSEIYGVVTFYSRFTLNPVGKYKVSVCLGTACYVKGASKVLENVESCLGIKAGETSEDGEFSIEACRCVGACGLAPIMTVNEDVYGKLNADEVQNILAKYK